MKYLITGLPGSNPLPVEQGAALLQAGKAWIKERIADGSLDCHYSFFGGGGIAIGNATSHEELLADILAYPLYPFFEWDVQPLLEFEEAYENYIEFYHQIAG